MTVEDHLEVIETIKSHTKSVFNNDSDGSLTPVMHVVDKEGKMILMMLAMNLEVEEKDMIEQMMIMQALDGAQAIAFISEAWTVGSNAAFWDANKSSSVADVRCPVPSESPDRIEVVNLIYCTPEREWIFSAKIFRPPGNDPFISTWGGFGTMQPGSEEYEKYNKEGSEPSIDSGRFNAAWIKADRLKLLSKHRYPGIVDAMMSKWKNMLEQRSIDPDDLPEDYE